MIAAMHVAARAAVVAATFCASWSGSAQAETPRLPAETVDAFHAALRQKDTAGALSLLDRSVVVFELGKADVSAQAYALAHLATDIDLAAATQWTLQSRRLGGEGAERWVLSTYRVAGRPADGGPIDHTMFETAIVRRVGDAFRIVHLHWSTDRESRAGAPPR